MEEDIFTYNLTGEEKVFIRWHGKLVMVLKGKEAQKFMGKIASLGSKEAQLVMAKATRNFKRGNER